MDSLLIGWREVIGSQHHQPPGSSGSVSMCLWVAYSYLLLPCRGFSSWKTTQRTWLRVLFMALKEELKVLDFI